MAETKLSSLEREVYRSSKDFVASSDHFSARLAAENCVSAFRKHTELTKCENPNLRNAATYCSYYLAMLSQ